MSGSPAGDPLAPVMMTLAGIAYGQPSAIPGYLAADPLTQGEWGVDWIAADEAVPLNFAYIACSARTGAHVVAIRGTYPDPLSSAYWDDANQDSPFGPMQPWPIPASGGAKVSHGTWAAFNSLVGLAGTGRAGDARTFQQAIGAIPRDAAVYVTGHSLGGTLAPVTALWMAQQAAPLVATAYAFAGMTPGNAAFAALFGPGTALAGRVWRCNNTLDTVPYGWDRVLATRSFYEPAPRGGLLVEAALTAMDLALLPYGFTAIGAEMKLAGTVRAPRASCELVAYVLENLHQHLPDTYLALLGAPGLPFTIGFGAFVAPNGHPVAERMTANRTLVAYL